MESEKNLRFRCQHHKLKPNPEYAKKDDAFFKDRFVKVAFQGRPPNCCELSKEWMWVKVESIKNGLISGRLDNDPFLDMELKCGSPVEVRTSEVNSVFDPKLKRELEP